MAAPRALPGWFALLYAAFPGVFFGVWRDLSEPLAYSLTAVALLAFDGERPRRSRSPALFLPSRSSHGEGRRLRARLGRSARAPGRRLRATLFAIGSLLPYLAYQFVFLNQWLGNAGLPEKLQPTPVPFGGIGHYFPWGGVELQRVYAVLLPGCFCVALAVVALVRGQEAPPFGPCSRTRSSSWCSCRPPPTRTTRRQAGSRRASFLHSCCRCRP